MVKYIANIYIGLGIDKKMKLIRSHEIKSVLRTDSMKKMKLIKPILILVRITYREINSSEKCDGTFEIIFP